MTETAYDLQKVLEVLEEFHVYCFEQKLNVNVEKKDTSFFSKGSKLQIFC